MDNNSIEEYGFYESASERISEEFERDSRRYDAAFTEEEEAGII